MTQNTEHGTMRTDEQQEQRSAAEPSAKRPWRAPQLIRMFNSTVESGKSTVGGSELVTICHTTTAPGSNSNYSGHIFTTGVDMMCTTSSGMIGSWKAGAWQGPS